MVSSALLGGIAGLLLAAPEVGVVLIARELGSAGRVNRGWLSRVTFQVPKSERNYSRSCAMPLAVIRT